jgi:integrase
MSVRKRGKSWLVTVELGRDEYGRRRRHCSTHATEREAKAAEAVAMGEVAKGEWFNESDISTGDFLDGWLEYIRPHVEASTHEMWSGFARCHIKPALGRVPLAKLRKVQIDAYESRLLKSGRRPLERRKTRPGETREPIVQERPGLSPTTVRKHRMMLHNAFEYAVSRELLRRNPVDGMAPLAEEHHEVRWLELSEQQRLLAAARGNASEPPLIYLLCVAALATGMRKGEILALRERDLDFAHDRIAVRRGRQDNLSGAVTYRAGGKNGKGRVLSAPSSLMELLAAHMRATAARRPMAGDLWREEGLVFCDAYGGPVNIHGVKSAWRRLIEKVELPGVRFHDLRHTHATELLRAGVHPKIVSERLGHSSVKITLDRYSHVIPDLQTEAAEKTDILLRGIMPDAVT